METRDAQVPQILNEQSAGGQRCQSRSPLTWQAEGAQEGGLFGKRVKICVWVPVTASPSSVPLSIQVTP